jgi:hypothetical protein
VADAVFEKVWLQSAPPRAALRAYRDRSTGTLTVSHDSAEFVSDATSLRIDQVVNVSIGRRGTDFFNSWVEVRYLNGDEARTVFINDGGWLGWRPLLTGSNRRILHVLQGIAP